MSHRNVGAFTLPQGTMPAYVSVNFTPARPGPTDHEGEFPMSAFVTIDVRGHARQQVNGHMVEGPTVRICMTPEEFRVFLRDMAVRALAEGASVMPAFTVTYVQEATQTVNAADIHAAGALAKQYARDHKGLAVLTVYPAHTPALAPPPPAA